MKESTRIGRFVVIGSVNALITAVVIWVMMDVLLYGYLLSNVVAYLVAQGHNFIWSKYWIFPKENGNTLRQLLLFTLAFVLAYTFQFFFLLLMVERLSVNEYLAQFLGLFVYGGTNFLINRKLTFR